MARLPNFLVIIRSEKLSGKGQGRGCLGVRKKERFVLGKRTFRSQKSKHFVLRIIQQAMMLWSKENRPKLLRLIKLVGSEANNSFWRVLASLKELLPDGDDLKQVNELLANSEELIQSCQKDITGQATQMNLGF